MNGLSKQLPNLRSVINSSKPFALTDCLESIERHQGRQTKREGTARYSTTVSGANKEKLVERGCTLSLLLPSLVWKAERWESLSSWKPLLLAIRRLTVRGIINPHTQTVKGIINPHTHDGKSYHQSTKQMVRDIINTQNRQYNP